MWLLVALLTCVSLCVNAGQSFYWEQRSTQHRSRHFTGACSPGGNKNDRTELWVRLLKLIIINYNLYEFIYNKYILYNGLSNYTCYEVIKLYIINRIQYVS
jgi:hypothetical protein